VSEAAEVLDLGLGGDPRQWRWRLYTERTWEDKYPASYVRLGAIQELLAPIMSAYEGPTRERLVETALDEGVQRVRKVQVLPGGRAVYFETSDDHGDYGYTVTFPEITQ
jgi:hypothetical protein